MQNITSFQPSFEAEQNRVPRVRDLTDYECTQDIIFGDSDYWGETICSLKFSSNNALKYSCILSLTNQQLNHSGF